MVGDVNADGIADVKLIDDSVVFYGYAADARLAEQSGDMYRAFAAVIDGDVAMLQALLDDGLEAHCALQHDTEEHTLLHTAVRHNRVECIRVPVAQPDTDTEVSDASGLTPLQLAQKPGHATCAEVLENAMEE